MDNPSLKKGVSDQTFGQITENPSPKGRASDPIWEQVIEDVGCELTEVEFEDALVEDELCNYSHPLIVEALEDIIAGASSPLERAKKIYRFAREEIGYSFLDYRISPASEALSARAGGCVNKAILATALYRRARIPAIYGVGLIKASSLISLMGKLWSEIVDNSLVKLDESNEAEDARWREAKKLRDGWIQADKTLHISSCIYVEGRWFEADVAQNNRFMIRVAQADKYFPSALKMWDGRADYGIPDHFYLGGKKKLRYLTDTENLKLLFNLDGHLGEEIVAELFDELRQQSSAIEFWFGMRPPDSQ